MAWFKKKESPGIFANLKNSLAKTRNNFTKNISSIFTNKEITLSKELLSELEEKLLLADCGIETTSLIIEKLKAYRSDFDNQEIWKVIENILIEILQPCEKEIDFSKSPTTILFVGINGAGKTTTIGKIANILKQEGKKPLLAAGDTFRAAAVEQLQVWGERNDVSVISQTTGSDSASVIFDAMHSAVAKKYDVVLADTAGRLHTQSHLMSELVKIIKVAKKVDESFPHEKIIILDATLGQNTITQVEEFHSKITLTGLVITKLDGTAKGGVLFYLAQKFKLPIYYIGIGEGINDLKKFDVREFIRAIL